MSTFPPPTTAPAGWYPNPGGTGTRYFDGRQWAPVGPVFEEREAHPELPMAAAIGALAILLCSLLVGKSLVEWLVRFDWPVIVYVVILATIGYGPSVAWSWYVRGRWAGGESSAIGWRFRWADLGWGPLTYVAAFGSQVVVAAIVLLLDIPLTSNVEDVNDLNVDRAYLVATVITAVIAAPVIEEIIFRGVVLRGFLSKLGPVAAVGLQGVLFGVAHVDPVRGVGNLGLAMVLSAVGVALGTAAYLTRRVGPTVIAHAIFNGVVMIIVLTGVIDRVDPDVGHLLAAMLR